MNDIFYDATHIFEGIKCYLSYFIEIFLYLNMTCENQYIEASITFNRIFFIHSGHVSKMSIKNFCLQKEMIKHVL